MTQLARFFFDTTDGQNGFSDESGLELPTPEAAAIEAMRFLPELARELSFDGDLHQLTASVRNESGQVVCHATLSISTVWMN